MIKVLFFIHDLGPGGAEKVLVNLVNNMDRSRFDITVMTLFGDGENERFLHKDIRLINCHRKAFRGNIHVMKMFPASWLYHYYIREQYDVIVSYLEGSTARIVSGCTDKRTKLVSWIHIEQKTKEYASSAFRSYEESVKCYQKFHRTVCVSKTVRQDFMSLYQVNHPVDVLYNTNESAVILQKAEEPVATELFKNGEFALVGVGKLGFNKGFDRLIRIQKRLVNEGYLTHLYILGKGSRRDELAKIADDMGIGDSVTFLGYQTNPYKYVAKCDLFVCSSYAEGFSTAATEALIVGTPVVTTLVSGMKEMLGENDEWGIITENDEEALYQGIKRFLDDPKLYAHYKEKAAERGGWFSTENTVKAVEEMLLSL